MQDMLIYYGWLNAFNSAENQWDNEKVANDLAKYNILVFGDGLENPPHGDYANTVVIINRIKAIKPSIKIFGYASTNLDLSVFTGKVNGWSVLGVNGIFMDEAGYDYGKTREDFNDRVDCVHGKGMLVFANAWNPDHVFGTAEDVSYPNSLFNPYLIQSNLDGSDWLLMENSGIVNTMHEDMALWQTRVNKVLALHETHKFNYAACSVINNTTANGADLFKFGYCAALIAGANAYGSSDIYYGASSAAVKWWVRPGVAIGAPEAVIGSFGTTQFKYFSSGKIVLNFAIGSELATITKW
jgi:hypothetical protein